MADFCRSCSIDMFGEDLDDIKAELGGTLTFLCEGCGGFVTVDHDGNKVEEDKKD